MGTEGRVSMLFVLMIAVAHGLPTITRGPSTALHMLDLGASEIDQMDADWQSFLVSPPARSVSMAQNLSTRADAIVDALGTAPSFSMSGDFDVVISGGGDLNAYYLGVDMILSRLLERNTTTLKQQRRAGASGGGWISFEIALKGQQRTLESYLSYGMLQEKYPVSFLTPVTAIALQDHHWRQMAYWQSSKWESSLPLLDDKVFLAISCAKHWWTDATMELVSKYTSVNQSVTAFIGTGAFSETYEGMSCHDGSGVSGGNMTPLFQDHVRQQLIIEIMAATNAAGTVAMGDGKFNADQYFALVERGQDEMTEFLKTGTVKRKGNVAYSGPITLCPARSDVKKNECKLL